jgi:hypothetical protein
LRRKGQAGVLLKQTRVKLCQCSLAQKTDLSSLCQTLKAPVFGHNFQCLGPVRNEAELEALTETEDRIVLGRCGATTGLVGIAHSFLQFLHRLPQGRHRQYHRQQPCGPDNASKSRSY